jgi:hypothetical protein
MNSRVAISALFILIAAMVVASQGTGLREKLRVLQTSCANTISEVRTLPILNHSCATGNKLPRSGRNHFARRPDHHFQFSQHDILSGSNARYLQRLVLNLINSDHRGE